MQQKINRLLAQLQQTALHNKYLHFSEEDFQTLDNTTIEHIVAEFGGKYMFRLPKPEILFNEWLKIHDPAVWQDLWSDPENPQNGCHCGSEQCTHQTQAAAELYYVSINLLPVVMNPDGRGLPICDLQTTDNYYFCLANMVDEESKILIDVASKLFRAGKQLTPAQLLALEISLDPIDIWHFAYKHQIPLETAKNAVAQLVDDGALVHLTLAEYLVPFIPF